MKFMLSHSFLAVVISTLFLTQGCIPPKTWFQDLDGDGYGDPHSKRINAVRPGGYVDNNQDCDDLNPAINPGATEELDSYDNDCDGQIDEGFDVPTTWYYDGDGDGFGDDDASMSAIEQPSNFVATAGDCDDSNAAINPDATEIYDSIDNDCDGLIDEDVSGPTTWYRDSDSDSYGDDADTQMSVTQPTGYVDRGGDCDDSASAINPDATEAYDSVDNNCDGNIDEGFSPQNWYNDTDGDSYGDSGDSVYDIAENIPSGYIADNSDCDDSNAAVNPGASEVYNGIDDNCDGNIDEGFTTTTFYRDSDGDSYGDAGNSVVDVAQPSGYVLNATDCDDSNAAINPGATETANGIDDDCDGAIDEAMATWYLDADSDSYGDPANSQDAVSAPSGYVGNSQDCDDSDAGVNPAASEVYNNGKDDNCDGSQDEGFSIYYRDSDSDGYGDAATTQAATSQPSGFVTDNNDCDDTDSAINPGASEVYDGVDNNCSGGIDEGFVQYFQDVDGDLYGNAAVSQWATSAPSGYVADSADCDDSDAAINPAADEVTDGADNDCDGFTDEGGTDWYRDSDADTYGDSSDSLNYIGQPSGYVADSTDCDDTNAAINPGATEIYNSVDDNCNGSIDEGISTSTYYPDADGDNYGDEASSGSLYETGAQPSGWVLDNTDCNDGNSAINPGASETANGVDDNCNGEVDEGLGADYTNADVQAAWEQFFTEVVCSRASCVNPAGTGDFSFSCDTGSVTWDITASAVTQTFNNCTHTIQAGTYGSPNTSDPLYGITITVNGQIVGVPDGTQGDIYPDGTLTITGDYEATIFDQRDVHQQIPTVHNYGDASDADHSFYTDVTCSAPSCATNAVRFFADGIQVQPYAATSSNPGLEGPTYDSGTEL